jgi:hypothetical protein
MNRCPTIAVIQGAAMENLMQQSVELQTSDKARSFNYNKLQAAICIVSSSIVSVGLIIWLVKTFF